MHLIDGTLVLSATDLTGFLACEHLTELDRAVAEGRIPAAVRDDDPELELLRRRGDAHEQGHLESLRAEGRTVVEIPRGTSTLEGLYEWEALTVAAMRAGAGVIFQAAFFDGRWHGRADFLLRVEEPSDLGSWSYEVADTKLARSLKAAALLQTAEYSLQVERIQGRAPRHLHIVLGDGRTERCAVADVVAYHRAARRRLEEVVDGSPRATYPERVEHCRVCRWADGCAERRRVDDHLSFVAGMRRDQIRRLEAAGVRTLQSLAVTLPVVPGMSEDALGNLHAQAALQLRQRADGVMRHELRPPGDGAHGLAALPEPSPGDLFFDMEGDPWACDTGLEYLFGITEVVDGAPRYHAFWGHDREGERRAFEQLVDLVVARLQRDPSLHVYHYAAYELSALRRLAGQHATREDEVDRLLRGGVLVDLYRVVRQGVRVSAESYGLKSLEPLFMPRRHGAITDGGSSIVEYERWLENRDPAILDAIAEYNAADCESTWRLRGWLEERRAELEAQTGAPPPRPEPADGAPSEEVARESEEARELAGRLLARRSGGPEADAATRLLAGLLDWHRREDRPAWWAYYARLAMADDQLHEDPDSIAGLTFDGVAGTLGSSELHRYRFDPAQEFTIRVGDRPVDPATRRSPGEVAEIDGERGVLVLRRWPSARAQPHPRALVSGGPIPTTALRRALRRTGEWVALHGIDAPGPHRAARDLLLRRPPRVAGHRDGDPLRRGGETPVDAGRRLALDLDAGCLPVQGPPGSGKTYTAARMILDLLRQGRSVGITAMSHRAIGNLLDEVCRHAEQSGVEITAVQKADEHQRCASDVVRCAGSVAEVVAALAEGPAVVAGTAWLFCHETMEGAVDTLVVDEAGQVSLANVVATAGAARNLVLCGDPQQLRQPVQGTHPEGADRSALEHLLAGERTVADGRGLFLDSTWRMHPDVCAFVSEAFYDGRLSGRAECARQAVTAPPPFDGAGVRYLPVVHEGNRVTSPEEVAAVRDVVDLLLREGRWTDRRGHRRPITLDDILVVAPYNAHVNRLQDALPPGARVGTVDRFQGQEAPVVIYTMATSSGDDQRRSMDFLYSLNRLNVAISRAQAMAVLVCSPALLGVHCRTADQLTLANALCRLVEMAGDGDALPSFGWIPVPARA
ncbi:MAG TPA: TM0106 family RecB-like putative nuclease [Candidatus Dormibacteraeota bacterium]